MSAWGPVLFSGFDRFHILHCRAQHMAEAFVVDHGALVDRSELAPEDLESAIQSKASIAQTRRRLREAGLPSAMKRGINALAAPI
jgi:hypothetical protein